MLNAEVKVLTVDWKPVLDALLPAVVRRTQQIEHPSFLIRLLNKLGESTNAFIIFLTALSDETRNELICMLLNQYHEKIVEILNDILAHDEKKYPIHFSGFSARQDDNTLCICLTNIDVDYATLLSNSYAQFAVRMFHNHLDMAVTWVLQKQPELLTNKIQDMFEERGLTGIDMKIALVEGRTQEMAVLQVSESAQAEILDVLVSFINRITRLDGAT